jgi:hypothetical protein
VATCLLSLFLQDTSLLFVLECNAICRTLFKFIVTMFELCLHGSLLVSRLIFFELPHGLYWFIGSHAGCLIWFCLNHSVNYYIVCALGFIDKVLLRGIFH